MSVIVTHAFVSGVADDPSHPEWVRPSNWNADHVITGLDIRIQLTGNTTFYVSTTGSDITGDGSIGAPWKTLQFAWDTICAAFDLQSFVATIQLDDGDYPDPFIPINQPVGGYMGRTSVPAANSSI